MLGLVPLVGREPLACGSFNGRALFLSAVDALAQVANPPVMVLTDDVQTSSARHVLASYRAVVDLAECPRDDQRFRAAASTADVVVIHDPLCPLVSAASLRQVVRTWTAGSAAVAVRPVVDTVKAAADGVVSGTVDRDALRIVSSPLVLPAALVPDITDLTAALADLGGFVRWLRDRCHVKLLAAPSASTRIEDVSSMRLMSSVDAVGHRLRER
ncbi:MAG: 2-C-methyl-D-erythritol 4-phosphate cytidylyltransferase [Propionibacteriales bacterium]|nr:2-C-methyl-D-erythritol 4-phosphate cytidylyltransferase [Propionibacteriales bacterium]